MKDTKVKLVSCEVPLNTPIKIIKKGNRIGYRKIDILKVLSDVVPEKATENSVLQIDSGYFVNCLYHPDALRAWNSCIDKIKQNIKN